MPTSRSDLILPEVLAPDVMKGFAGKPALAGSGVVLVNTGLQAGAEEVNNTVTVPYFEDGGEAQVITEAGAGALEKQTMSSEQATVVRLFKGFSMTRLARMAKSTGRDIYDVATEQIQSAFARSIDTLAVVRALARAAAAGMEHDGTASTVTPQAVVETLKLFGEDLDDDMLGVWAMNPKPYWDMAQLTDSTGRTLYTDVQGGRLTQVGGAPVRMTAKSDLVVAGSPTTYKSLLAKKGALVAWYNEKPKIDIERDASADVDMLMANLYIVIHAYGTMPGETHAGVAVLKSR